MVLPWLSLSMCTGILLNLDQNPSRYFLFSFSLAFKSDILLHPEGSPALLFSIQRGRGILHSPPHPERLIRWCVLHPGQKHWIQMCCQECESFIKSRRASSKKYSPAAKNPEMLISFKLHCCSAHCCLSISDSTESLQLRGGEHVERSELSSSCGAVWCCEGGDEHRALHGSEAK